MTFSHFWNWWHTS